ncbi:hypothetical protein PVL29_009691 [Vitis rotundifolia]|uniref:Agamous-like MADS-box protein AGL80 n=1 Tax=Vitis rotundifolia TaxID=103349 RepID=A0AA39DRV1_VITRO|nr:hypothetical protein PVL29_009691 [Vitis rotundifolia]
MELFTLCGLEVAMVIFCPGDEPTFWPSKPVVEQLFRRYEEIPVMEQSKKMLNQENFLRERIAKIREQTRKCLKRSLEMEMNDLVYQIVNGNQMYELPIGDLTNVMRFLEEKNSEVRKRAQHLHEFPPFSGNGTPSSSSLPPGMISALEGAHREALIQREAWLNEIGMQQYEDILGLLHGISDIPMLPSGASNNMEFPQGNTHIAMAEEEMWLPYGNMGGSDGSRIPMESLHGSTDFPSTRWGPSMDLTLALHLVEIRSGYPIGMLIWWLGAIEIALPYGTGGSVAARGNINIGFPGAANRMGQPDRSNDSLITGVNLHGNTDFLIAGNHMGLPHYEKKGKQ